MHMRESAENYLETILILQHKLGKVRSIDIAHTLNFSKASISRALKLLRESHYIFLDKNRYVCLTSTGLEIAEHIYERHTILAKHFMWMGVDQQTALKDACRIEHIISSESFCKIKQYVQSKEADHDNPL